MSDEDMEVQEKTTPFSFLDGKPEDVVTKVHSLIKEEMPSNKKIPRIKELVDPDFFRNWMTEYGVRAIEVNVKDLNDVKNDWNLEMYLKLMETMKRMSMKEFNSFFDFCRTWVVEKDWPEDFVMHKAKEELGATESILVEERNNQPPVNGSLGEWVKVKHPNSDIDSKADENPHREQLPTDVEPPQKGPIPLDIPEPISEENEVVQGIEEVKIRHEPEEEPTKREENTLQIVLIGESGTGKTTMINGIANSFKYRSFEDAMRKGPRVCIPTQFTTFVGKRGNKHTIIRPSLTEATGHENNENVNDNCGSVTKDPVTYTFKYKSSNDALVTVNLTDTPGMNDTGGDDQDAVNITKITSHLEKLPFIDAICLVLKPNEARLSLNLRTMLKKLLSNLPKEHYGNIVICFSCCTKPGETLVVLREKYTYLNAEADNIFCYDNEPYRYLCLLKQHPEEKDSRRTELCKDIFEHNESELIKMLKRVESLKPFKVKQAIPPATVDSSAQMKPATSSSANLATSSTSNPTTSPYSSLNPPPSSTSATSNRSAEHDQNVPDWPSSSKTAPVVAMTAHNDSITRHTASSSLRQQTPTLTREEQAQQIVKKLVRPLASSIIQGIKAKNDLKFNIQAMENTLMETRSQGKPQSTSSIYCRDCNGQQCNFRNDGMNLCVCTHHIDSHVFEYQTTVPQECPGNNEDREIREQVALMSEELKNTEKEYKYIVSACLLFCLFLSPLPSYFKTRQFEYYDQLHKTLLSIYNEQKRRRSIDEPEKESLLHSLNDCLNHINDCLKNLASRSHTADLNNVEQTIRILATLETRKELSQAVSQLLSNNH